MAVNLDNLSNLSVDQIDAFNALEAKLLEKPEGKTVVVKLFGKIDRAKFLPNDSVGVFSFDDNNLFKLFEGKPVKNQWRKKDVKSALEGRVLRHQYRKNKDSPYGPETTLVTVKGGYFAFPRLTDGVGDDVMMLVVKVTG